MLLVCYISEGGMSLPLLSVSGGAGSVAKELAQMAHVDVQHGW